VNADDALQTAQAAAFENGVFPRYAIKIGKNANAEGMPTGQMNPMRPTLTAAQRRQLVEMVRKLYAGAVKAHEPVIIDGLIDDIVKISAMPAEMDFLQSGAAMKSRILQAYGVSPTLVGEIEGANRAQAVTAENVFCTTVCNPLLELFAQVLTRHVCPRFAETGESLVAWFDPCAAHDREMTLEEWRVGLQFQCVAPDEYRNAVLNLPPLPFGGDFPHNESPGDKFAGFVGDVVREMFAQEGARLLFPGKKPLEPSANGDE
jgi:phage portal protein BeeE